MIPFLSICVRLDSALSLIGPLAAGLRRSALLHVVRCHILCYRVRDPSNKRLNWCNTKFVQDSSTEGASATSC